MIKTVEFKHKRIVFSETEDIKLRWFTVVEELKLSFSFWNLELEEHVPLSRSKRDG